ncbi:unnamed protein product [Porites evermanni]|uniref:Uncharacterized protein n=1 Tax=Porites evermanni TaxID=104178 RepID=A0ABN8MF93_9CNID|nr:unnamed protein product [Porites evermanni]
MSITLYDEQSNTYEFAESEPNLLKSRNFKKADVTAGTWVLYTYPNYNDKEGGTEDTFKIVKDGVKDVDITSVNGSMFLIDGGIVLFEHFLYGGDRKWFQDSCADVNSIFPSGTAQGVSSAIVFSKNRSVDIFTKPNYEGTKFTLEPGKWYEKLNKGVTGFALNDKLQSFKFNPKA